MSHYAVTMLSLPKKKHFCIFIVFLNSHEARDTLFRLRTHNVSDKALLNVCLPSLTCWDKFHITPSMPEENVIRGLERPHTNKRSVLLSLAWHKASVWKWVRCFQARPEWEETLSLYTQGWSGNSLRLHSQKHSPDYITHPQKHRGKGLSLMEVHFAVFVL